MEFPMTVVSSGQTSAVSSGSPSGGWIVLSGGILNVLSSGIISGAIDSGGDDSVFSGGVAVNTTVSSGGFEYVDGGTTTGTIIDSGGQQQLVYEDAGVAIGTIINSGGLQTLNFNTTASNTTISNGGEQDVFGGSAIGTVIKSGGFENNENSDNGTIVDSGGYLEVGNFGTSTNVTISGGLAELIASNGSFVGAFGGAITFAGQGGELKLDDPSMPTNVISGFAPGDTIDLAGVGFTSGGSVQLHSGNVLQVVESGATYSLQFNSSQSFSGETFHLVPDGGSGTTIALGQVTTISAGQTSNNTSVTRSDSSSATAARPLRHSKRTPRPSRPIAAARLTRRHDSC
jgi:autotransporter passenger strand-loop-strand repeat protein